MEIPQEELADVERYLKQHHVPSPEDQEKRFQFYSKLMERFGRKIDASCRVLEVGTGTGWMLVLFSKKGLNSEGLEISQQLVENARKMGREKGTEPNIRLGNIEEVDLGEAQYDFVIAAAVFEHVQHWERALKTISRALKPGGLMYFTSTNKFSFTSGEYNFPLYGWLPDEWRFKLRMARQGPEIMKLGIDFNQFRPGQLRRAFKDAGFSKVLDVFEYTDVTQVRNPLKRAFIHAVRASSIVHYLAATFFYGTLYLCIK